MQTIQDAENVFRQDSDVYNNMQIKSSLEKLPSIYQVLQEQRLERMTEKDHQCIRDLRLIDPRDEIKKIEERKDHLLKDSYAWILGCQEYQNFMNWEDGNKHRLLWIKGQAGKGKTMLLIGIIRELERLNSIPYSPNLSYFFCQGTNSMLNTPTAVLRCLIWLMLDQQPFLVSHIRKRYDTAGADLFKDNNAFYFLRDAFKSMLKDPRLERVFLIVDALDECIDKDTTGLALLLDLISTTVATSPNIKWLVSSRNRPDIESRLKDGEDCVRLDLELNSECIRNAVDAYIDYKLSKLDSLKQYRNEVLLRITEELRRKADGTFLWVALVCKELESVENYYALAVLYEMPSDLKDLYSRMMDQIEELKRDDPKYCKSVLSTITLAYRPLHLLELETFIGLPIDVPIFEIIKKCASFLTVRNDVVYLIHQSAKDYLTVDADSKILHDGRAKGHGMMVSCSLEAMSKILRRDIYGLRDLGHLIEQVSCPDPDPLTRIRYACLHWIDHLCETDHSLCDNRSIDSFLKKYLLYWLEALSLMRNMSRGVSMIRKLENLLSASINKLPLLLDLVRDTRRFILHNRWVIENAPLQIYVSALVFSPTHSLTREQWKKEEPEWMITKPIMERNWSPCLQTLEGHSAWVRSVVFSHDSRQLASASDDRTVKVWDAATGECLRTLEGHSAWVRSVVFSHDSRQLASASDDRTVKVWDAATGECLRTLEGHSAWVRSVVFSHDSRQLASASGDRTVKVWDAVMGECLRTLEGHSAWVRSVVFSHDSRQLASASGDRTVKVWDAATGECLRTLEGHSAWVWSVVFSHDSRQLASASDDRTVKVWDAAMGECLRTLEGHSAWVWSVVFSHDSRQLASASGDRTVKVWDAVTGECLRTLEGHSAWVWSVVFSHDSRQLVSASDDRTVKVWDAVTGECLRTLEGHSALVSSVVFSHDSRQLASASGDRTVKVWDAATGECLRTLEGHSASVRSVVFSHDSRQLASASGDRTVKVWDAATGECLRTLEGHSAWVWSVMFSHDSRQLASASDDRTVKVWDAVTGECLRMLEGHSASVWSVVFSHDSRQLASASGDRTIKVWDAATGECLWTLEGHSAWVWSVVFSHDSRQLASASGDRTVKVWDAATGECLRALEGHSASVWSVVFSHDSRQLASASGDRTVKVWDAATGECLRTLEGHSDLVWSVKSAGTTAPREFQESKHSYGLSSDRSWITWDGRNVLWLPSEYRPVNYPSSSFTVSGSTMVIGCQSGRVIIIRFSLALSFMMK